MKTWLSTEFGQLTLASILALIAFPLLYIGGFGQDQGLIWLGLVIFAVAFTIPLAGIFKIKKQEKYTTRS